MAENEKTADLPANVQDESKEVIWTASEFVAHDKSAGWYIMLLLAAGLISAVIYLLTKDKISVAVVIVAALLLAYYGSHKPRELEYRLTYKGLNIDKKYYNFDDFRSFSVIQEGAFNSILLLPLKRFAPMLSIYYDPADEEKILEVLKSSLPYQERKRDTVDALMHRIRF
jgi:hypothetical protein